MAKKFFNQDANQNRDPVNVYCQDTVIPAYIEYTQEFVKLAKVLDNRINNNVRKYITYDALNSTDANIYTIQQHALKYDIRTTRNGLMSIPGMQKTIEKNMQFLEKLNKFNDHFRGLEHLLNLRIELEKQSVQKELPKNVTPNSLLNFRMKGLQ